MVMVEVVLACRDLNLDWQEEVKKTSFVNVVKYLNKWSPLFIKKRIVG